MALYENEEGQIRGWCFVCNRMDKNPLQLEDDLPEEKNQDQFTAIGDLPILELKHRGISKEVADYFSVRSELSQVDGKTVTAVYHPYTSGGKVVAYKKRTLPKDISIIGSWKDVELYGQSIALIKASHKRLFITEGEEDAMALFQALKLESQGGNWSHINPAVVSICNGANSAVKDISRNLAFVNSFEEVVLVFDQDEAGKQAVQEVIKLLPLAKVAEFSEKDSNDMLLKGKWRDLVKSVIFQSKRIKPSSIVGVEDVYDRAVAKPQMGLSWPWPTLTAATYGIHRKKIYGVGAGVGIGKTDWVKTVQAHLIDKHNLPVGLFMFEEDVGRTLKGIAGKRSHKIYHQPNSNVSDQELRGAIDALKGKVFLFDHFGSKDWSDVKASIRYMVVCENIKDIFIDPLTALVSHLSASEANDLLNTIMGDLAGMTHELDFTAYYLAHLNTPANGPPHERGGKVLEQQFTGSRAMMRWSQYILGLERNKDPELDKYQRNTATCVLLKDREFGNVCSFPIYYNDETGEFLEPSTGAY